MTVSRIVFIDGPKNGVVEHNYGAPIPTQRIPIYALANSGMQCDDEQVTYREGHYERFEITENGYAYFSWVPAEQP